MHVSNRSLFRSLLATGVAAAAGLAAAQMVPKTVTANQKPTQLSDRSEQGKADAAAKRNERSRGFIENKGQWPDEALFLGRSNGLNMWVTRDGLRFDAFRNSSAGTEGHVIGVQFVGGSKLMPAGLGEKSVRTDFMGYARDVRGAKTYDQVVTKNVYPGIALKSYFDGSRPRYDFILAPGAKAESIRMKLISARGFKASGSKLEIKTSVGSIVQQGLAAYQTVNGKRRPVAVAFSTIGKDSFGFKVGAYDKSKTLVIDPLIYGSYYGGDSGQDEVHAVVSDLVGGVYMTGSTRSVDFPVIYGPYSFSLNRAYKYTDGRDAFVSKLEGDVYRHDYAIYLGGTKDDSGDFLQLDQFGNLWVAGQTESQDFPGASNSAQVQYLYFDQIASQGHDAVGNYLNYPGLGGNGGGVPNGNGRFRVRLPGTSFDFAGWSDYIVWNADAATIQTTIQNYLNVALPGATVSVTPTSNNGNIMSPPDWAPLSDHRAGRGMRLSFSPNVKGEMLVDNTKLGAFYTTKSYGTASGRGQILYAADAQTPTTGQYFLTLAYTRNGQSYVAKTANLAYNAPPAAVQAALNNIQPSPSDPDQSAVLSGVVVSQAQQASTASLPAVDYLILFPVSTTNYATLVYNNVSMDKPYLVARTGVTDVYWDTSSSPPTGPDPHNGVVQTDYDAAGGAFNVSSGGRYSADPVKWNTTGDELQDQLQTIPSLAGNTVVVPGDGATPGTVLTVFGVNNLQGSAPGLAIANNQVWTGGALGAAAPVMLSQGRISPTPVYKTRSESKTFLMRFVQDANTSLNPLPTKIYFFGGSQAATITGFKIIPHDNPVAGEAIRFAFSGTVDNPDQLVPEIPGVPRITGGFWAIPAGFFLRVNYTDASGFSVVNSASQYVDAAGTIDGVDYHLNTLVNGLDVDANGNIYVSGTVKGPFGNTIDTSQVDDNGNYLFKTTSVDSTSYLREGRLLRGYDGFVRKYSANGTLTYSVLIGGDGNDEGFGVAVDSNGNAYMAGRSRSFNYPRTRGVFGETFTSNTVCTVIKLNPSATDLTYATHLNTGGSVTPVGIAVDSRGIAYCTFIVSRGTIFQEWTPDNDPNMPGGFESVGSIPVGGDVVKNAFSQSTNQSDNGGTDGALLGLNPSATGIVLGTYLGGTLDDTVYLPYVDKGGDVWVCGYTDTFRAYIRPAKWGTSIRRLQVLSTLPGAMITDLAFRHAPDPNIGIGGSGTQLTEWGTYNTEFDYDPHYINSYRDRDGYVERFRVGLTSVLSVGFTPGTIAGGLGASSTGTVTLSQNAPAGGAEVVITMSSSAPASFSPTTQVSTTSIVIPGGAKTGTFTLYSQAVADNTPVDVTATYQGNFKVGRVVITPWLQSFSITPQEVVGGNTVAGRIQLAFPAGTGGMNVTINSDKPGIVPVTNVTVPAGQNSAVFNINTNGVDYDNTVTVTASLLGIGKAFQLVVHPAQLKTLTFNPASVTSGSSSTGTLVLNGKAGGNGFDVTLQVEGAPAGYVMTPSTLHFSAGATTKTFTITTPYENATVPRIVDATMQPAYGYTPNTVKGTLNVSAVSITDLTITPNSVAGGTTVSGQVTLSAPALAGGAKVDISVSPNDGVVTVPTSVTVPAGQTTFTFSIPTTTTISTTNYTVTASRGASFDTATLTVTGLTFGLTIPAVIPGGSSTTGTVTLSGPAPIGGLAVTLTSSNPTLLAVAGTVTIPGGQTSVTFPLTASNVTSDTNVNVSAKIGSTTVTKSTTVTASKLIGMTISPSYVMNLTSTTITLKLNGPAPAAGLVVNLSNTNPFIVSVPTQVKVPAGKSSYSFSVMTYRVTRTLSATIAGASQNNGSASALITVHN